MASAHRDHFILVSNAQWPVIPDRWAHNNINNICTLVNYYVNILLCHSLQRYNLFNNNCEHVAMLATIGRRLSIQVSKELYDDLNTINQRIATPMVVHGSDVLARNSSKGVIKATGKIVGSVVTRAAARAAVKGGITGGAAESTETSECTVDCA